MAAGAAVAAAGTGIQLIAQSEQAKLQEREIRDRASALNQQATEIQTRFDLFTKPDIERRRQLVESEQVSSFAAGGVDVSSGSTLEKIQETAQLAQEELIRAEREALFQQETLRNEARNLESQIPGLRTANRLQQFGTLLQGAGSFAKASGAFSKGKKLTKPGTGA